MKTHSIKEGSRVMCNGYEGRVMRVLSFAAMAEVRVPGGITVVSIAELIRFTPKDWLK
jgi:hypothetical protein